MVHSDQVTDCNWKIVESDIKPEWHKQIVMW